MAAWFFIIQYRLMPVAALMSIAAAPPSDTTDDILLESGDFLLLESGDKLLLE